MAAEVPKSSIFDAIQRTTLFSSLRGSMHQSLPISQTQNPTDGGLRRRLSSLSLKLPPAAASAASWSFQRSKSMSAMSDYAGSSLRKWWEWGWAWVVSRKPSFAGDLEMNEEESAMLGVQSKGSWRHLFYRIRSEFRKMVGPGQLPVTQKFRYDSFSYAQNFDDGKKLEQATLVI